MRDREDVKAEHHAIGWGFGCGLIAGGLMQFWLPGKMSLANIVVAGIVWAGISMWREVRRMHIDTQLTQLQRKRPDA